MENKFAHTPTPEQKKAAKKAAETAKATAIIAAKYTFSFTRTVVRKTLGLVHLERFATPVTVFLLFGLVVSGLRSIPGYDHLITVAAEFASTVIAYALMAFVAVMLIRFIKRCYAEARSEQAKQSKAEAARADSSQES